MQNKQRLAIAVAESHTARM
jgi:hypothetical protein